MYSRKNRPLHNAVKAAAAAGISVLAAVSLAACSGATATAPSDSTSTSGVKLVKDGQLSVCTHLPYKPFEYNENGQVVGFEVDLMGLLAKKLNVTQSTVDVDWVQVTSGAAFKTKRCDIGMGGMTITDKRKQSILISDPYFDATQALLVKKDSGIHNLADLRGKKIGAQTDTTGQDYAKKNADANGYTIVTFDDLALLEAAVKAGRVDAAINDNGVLYDYVKDNPDTEVATEFSTGEQYGFAGLKDDANATKLMDMLNQEIATAKSNGEYDTIFKKWFGTTPAVKG